MSDTSTHQEPIVETKNSLALEKKELLPIPANVQKFISRVTNPFLFKIGMLVKLPMGFLARLNIKYLDMSTAKVTVPYGWINQNPFKSTYFAVLSMAAEMSTGVFGLMAVENAVEPVSMLVVSLESKFVKKATNLTTFTCNQGMEFFNAVEETCSTGEPVTIVANSIGLNEQGEEVARFKVTWSIKKKSKKSA